MRNNKRGLINKMEKMDDKLEKDIDQGKLFETCFKYGLIGFIILSLLFFIGNHLLFFVPYTKAFIINTVFLGLFILVFYFLSKKKFLTAITIAIFLILSFSGLKIVTSKIAIPEKYRELAGNIETHEFTKDISVVDLEKLPIIDSSLAKTLADKKLGEIPSLGSQMTIGELTLQKVGDTLYYVAPLEFTGFFKWFNNRGGSPGYVKVNAQVENEVELITNLEGKDLKLKYLQNSYFSENLKRKAFSMIKDKHLTDYTFEIDDKGNPYWVISAYTKDFIYNGDKVVETLIIDAQTGDYKVYNIDETPKWVDRIQPLSIINNNLNNWGKLVHGIFNFSNKDKLKTTNGYKLVYNNNKCYYYTGITSVGSDEALVGFFLTDTRTGETNMYKVNGAIESVAMASAQGKVAEKDGWKASFPLLINLQNEPTYFMTLKDAKGLIKGYSFVNVKNYNVVSYGETLNSSYQKYIGLIASNEDSSLKNNSELKELKGVIDRIGASLSNDNIIYNITLKDSKNVLKVPDNFLEATLSKVGDNISIKYIDNNSSIITPKEFDNKNINIK